MGLRPVGPMGPGCSRPLLHRTKTFAAMVDELRGDILVDKGDTEAGAKAYEAALQSTTLSSAVRTRVQIKLDNLGLGEGFGTEQ